MAMKKAQKQGMTTLRTERTLRPGDLVKMGMSDPKSETRIPETGQSSGLADMQKPHKAATPDSSSAPKASIDPKPAPDKARNLRGVSAKDGTTKAKIERAALHLFAEHGVDGVSTKQIAAAAGISEGAIYRHFSGKEELARSMMVAIHTRLTEMIAAADTAHDVFEDKIKFIVIHYCRIADEDWDLFQYHILHLHHFPKLSDTPLDSPIGAAAALLEKAMERGELEPVDPYILAAMSLGVVVQAAQAKVFGYIQGPLAARTDLFTRRVLAVLKD